MAVGYLISVALPAVVTAAAVTPPPRSWAFGQLHWRLGMQANELPFIVVAWVVAGSALAATEGDLNSPLGIVGAVAAALTLLGSAVVIRRCLLARSIAARALAAGLGRSAIPELPRRPWARLIFTPLAVRRRDVVRRANLAYGPAGRANLLDLYLPRSGMVTGPCLIYFHGGGYLSGRKNHESRALIYRLASQGWLCVSANYRLAHDAPFPAALVDAKRAIAWLRSEAVERGADPAAMVVAGSSAGAHLAAMAALTANNGTLQPGFESAETRVMAAICLYGFYGSPTWIDRDPAAPSAPIDLLSADAPPMFIAHGTHDSFARVADVREFARRFRAAAPETPLAYLELPGAQHTFDLYRSIRVDAVLGAVDAFVEAVGVMRSQSDNAHSRTRRD